MKHLLYQIVIWICFIVALPFFIIYTLGGPAYEMRQRLGFYPRTGKAPGKEVRIWLHAASVGEAQVARALVAEINQQIPCAEIWVSTMTRHGHLVCRQTMPPAVNCIFAPLDLVGICAWAMQNINPDIYVCLETELWPEIIRQAKRRGAGPLLLNARLTEKSSRRYRAQPIYPVIRETISRFSAIAAIGEKDARRLQELGVNPDRIVVCGNAKHDLYPAATRQKPSAIGESEHGTSLRKNLGIAPEQPVLVAGSTHRGEEKVLLAAWHKLQRDLPDLVLVMAPRHLRRLRELEAFLRNRQVVFQRISAILAPVRQQKLPGINHHPPVLLVDKMGELTELYALTDFVFCGGSLIQRGGHNLLEAAAWGKPVLFGPFMDDFHEEAELLQQAGGGFKIHNAEEIHQQIMAFHLHPGAYRQAAQRARQVVEALRGAAAKQTTIIKEQLVVIQQSIRTRSR
ncbi:MAG: 3-deoxy-D-manno-octulosonic acid transferase [Desulfobulbaceae bacterium]|nr:MAG: 3-deoxy-D-manno-octulosonic acid transferase [Desulfobulbaceae bacterium]